MTTSAVLCYVKHECICNCDSQRGPGGPPAVNEASLQ